MKGRVRPGPREMLATDEEEASGSTRSAAAWRLRLWTSRSLNWPLSLHAYPGFSHELSIDPIEAERAREETIEHHRGEPLERAPTPG